MELADQINQMWRVGQRAAKTRGDDDVATQGEERNVLDGDRWQDRMEILCEKSGEDAVKIAELADQVERLTGQVAKLEEQLSVTVQSVTSAFDLISKLAHQVNDLEQKAMLLPVADLPKF